MNPLFVTVISAAGHLCIGSANLLRAHLGYYESAHGTELPTVPGRRGVSGTRLHVLARGQAWRGEL